MPKIIAKARLKLNQNITWELEVVAVLFLALFWACIYASDLRWTRQSTVPFICAKLNLLAGGGKANLPFLG
jgi:hypothetical protein